MIHICYGLYDRDGRYSKFVGTSIVSIFENTNFDVTIHILHDNTLSEENRDKFIYMAGHYSQTIKFYNVEKLLPDKINGFKEKLGAVEKTQFSIGTIYRLLMPHVFPQEISKIIYLDADTIVNLDIKELWQIEIADKTLAAVSEFETDTFYHNQRVADKENYLINEKFVNQEDYFNAGVLLLNTSAFRDADDFLNEGVTFIGENNCKFFDQDILNYCFSKNYLKLPVKFNGMVGNQRLISPQFFPQMKIYHYAGNNLSMNLDDNFNKLWFEYFSKTPWFNMEIFTNIDKNIRQIYAEQKNFAIQISAMMSGKKRAFFVEENYVPAVKNIFGVKDNEEVIPANSVDSLKNLIRSLKNIGGRGGNKLLFLLVNDYRSVHLHLVQSGFLPGQDFVNIWDFLSDAHGVPFNSASIIKNL